MTIEEQAEWFNSRRYSDPALASWNFRHMVNLPRIRQYIADNPARWSKDPENPVVRDVQDPFGVGATGRSPALVYNSITVDLEFYPEPLHTLGEIRDDVIALEKEPEGLLDEILRA